MSSRAMSLRYVGGFLGLLALLSSVPSAGAAGADGSLFGLQIRFAGIAQDGSTEYLPSPLDPADQSNPCFRRAVAKTRGVLEEIRTTSTYSSALATYENRCQDARVDLDLTLVATLVSSEQISFVTLAVQENKFGRLLDIAGTTPDNQTTIATSNPDGTSATMIGYRFKDDDSCESLQGSVLDKIDTERLSAEIASILRSRARRCLIAPEAPADAEKTQRPAIAEPQDAPTLSPPIHVPHQASGPSASAGSGK